MFKQSQACDLLLVHNALACSLRLAVTLQDETHQWQEWRNVVLSHKLLEL